MHSKVPSFYDPASVICTIGVIMRQKLTLPIRKPTLNTISADLPSETGDLQVVEVARGYVCDVNVWSLLLSVLCTDGVTIASGYEQV